MSTRYSDIYEYFLAAIQDYKIDKIFKESEEDAEEYMKPFLTRGLINFSNCKKDLEKRDDEFQEFEMELNTEEKVILSNLMLVEWLTREVNDILQMQNHLQDNDFRMHAADRNLREKSNHLSTTREVVNKQITKYGYKNKDWSNL